ncbi:4-(cytidine 5'-diphospho)-2-C-methyl-D-erythritol kinase [Paraeggerthella hongkongensis]|uniref:4-(cytidine 5'-diphospho)-2-C-methyl-D-erythritol kinase n=1 Tax=Paraeggerthella hominis TaxID=2897351 RepID=UPI001C10C956|nr:MULTISPECIES: 4-(cytidine 5'-diphospho)-2-C-methyl-D-erythritol kinase [Paraeggerthella]MBU5405504.1 4-(cytidine 5'-diphospho)-2-C-methyl-D-erythritol kinase [Paraeggerthella hongkongensis]MCD2432679.1 4-(cytidine 5'-diphospho)-2-C-methyl-D-erythritol kinase [Paraeggerthella hominis]
MTNTTELPESRPVSPGAEGPSSRANDPHVVDMFEVARIAQGVDVASFNAFGSVKLVAPAKVNLYLDIGEQRADGYHEVTTVMHALLLHDVLRMKTTPAALGAGLAVDLVSRSCEGLAPLDVAPSDNIVSKAIRRFAAALGRQQDETIVVSIEKHIPAEAGLGGGSSDAAAALVGAALLWGVPTDDALIEETARSLGADVAFFLHGGCACLTGVGDVLDHKLTPMNGPVVLIKPEGGVSTAAAYRAFDRNPSFVSADQRAIALRATRAQDVPLINNLVPVSEEMLPALADIRTWASSHEDVDASLMSGSGSAVFAMCKSIDAATRVAAQARSRGWWARPTTFGPSRATSVPVR